MRIRITLWIVLAALVLGVSGAGLAQAQQKEFPKLRENVPCTLDVEPINDDGSLRKTARLIELEKQHRVAPKDESVTRQLTEELFTLADFMMYCSKAMPKVKYPLAHCLYRRVLEIDRDNTVARESVDLIESIYDAMGKPRPSLECSQTTVEDSLPAVVAVRKFEAKCGLTFFTVNKVVLRNAADVAKYARNPECAAAFGGVDFSRDTLIAVELNTGWCGSPFGLRYRWLRDDVRRRYVLEVRYEVPREPCRARSQYELWIAVPAVPDGYVVEFDIAGEGIGAY